MSETKEFKLKELLETISDELKQTKKEARSTTNTEYSLENPVCDQSESEPGEEQELPD